MSEWNNTALNMDWAIPNDNPDEEAAEKSTAIMVNGISKKTFPGITDAVLKELFSKYGEVSSVRRKETNAKINFFDHEHAIAAIAGENGKELQGANLEIAVRVSLSTTFANILLIQSTSVNSYPDNSDLRVIRSYLRPPFRNYQSNIIWLIRVSHYSCYFVRSLTIRTRRIPLYLSKDCLK